MVAALILMFAYDEVQFNDPAAFPRPILLQHFMEALFERERCDEMARGMMIDVDMRKPWDKGLVHFNHIVDFRNPPIFKTLKHAFSRAAAFYLPDGFTATDIIIPVKIPGVETMTFCAAQVKKRKHDALTALIKTTAVVDLGKAIDKLEWSQSHIAIMTCLRYKTSSNKPSKKSTTGWLTESPTASEQFILYCRKKSMIRELAVWSRLAALPTTGVEESVYQSINLCGGERVANDNDVSTLLKKLLDCVLGTSFPDEAGDRVDHLSPFDLFT